MNNLNFYENGKIYKIVDNTNDNIYIGSTCKKLCQRIAQHRSNYKSYINEKGHYISSYDIIKNDNYDIVLIELFPCNSKEELHKRERYYIDTLLCVNKTIPTRTKKENYEENKETILEKCKEYCKNNREKVLKHKKEYNHENRLARSEWGKQYR